VKKGETIVALAQLPESMYKKDDEEKVFSISFISISLGAKPSPLGDPFKMI